MGKEREPGCYDSTDQGCSGLTSARPARVNGLLEQLRWLHGVGIEAVYGWVVGVEDFASIEIIGREVIPLASEWE